ncbi:hypothetical protein C5615_17865 [Burkholderia cepacia]|uniref:Uncharacterized protein n=1 Tax=Burkholderia cepacia TaxID=292 RepID=A0A2S8IQK6_BURCE|nr:hypothetical protein [Burkholderia cepacia]PQP17048.1 hypothetical protein C5615_17865 [Burkholderia cepacia]HDR9508156.1 hypothetical protein [Burkholderia cepacia]
MARMLIAPLADAGLAVAIRSGERLVERATAHGLAFALDELGDIAIPDPVAARVDKAQLRALASLYLAADLEPAGVIPAVEALAGLSASGAVGVDLGGAGPLVANWWRHRAERLAAGERAAFYSRLFGTAYGPAAADAERNVQFEECMLALCEALYKLDETPGADPRGDLGHQARVRNAARSLAQNLGAACTGVTAFMAGEIVGMLRDAFAILGHADMRQGFDAHDIWGVVAGIGRLSRQPPRQPAAHVRRGKAGMTVIAWLADVADALGGAAPLVTADNPVIAAAAEWIEATLGLGEKPDGQAPAAPDAGRGVPPALGPAAPENPWAALGR